MLRSYVWGPNKPQYWIVIVAVFGFGLYATHDPHAHDGKYVRAGADTWNGEWVGTLKPTPVPRDGILAAPRRTVVYLDLQVLNDRDKSVRHMSGRGAIAVEGAGPATTYDLDFVGPESHFNGPTDARDVTVTGPMEVLLGEGAHVTGMEGSLRLDFAPGRLKVLNTSRVDPFGIPAGELHRGTFADFEALVRALPPSGPSQDPTSGRPVAEACAACRQARHRAAASGDQGRCFRRP